MILRVRRNFFEITTFPNSGIRARFYALMLYARVEHKELLGDTSHTAYQQRLTLIQRYCWMKRPGPTLRVRLHETGFTAVLCTQVTSGCLFLQL